MTNLVRFSPVGELRRLQREIDRLFDGFPFQQEENDAPATAVWTPRVDLSETEDAFFIKLDVPGIPKENIEINFHNGTLTVSGERKAEETEKQHNYVRVERSYGHFYRSFTLPKAAEADKIEAKHENGVLSIRVPKAEESKPRRITVS